MCGVGGGIAEGAGTREDQKEAISATGLVKGETSRRGVTRRVAERYGNGKLLTNCQFAFK